jgi:hypothetical protein
MDLRGYRLVAGTTVKTPDETIDRQDNGERDRHNAKPHDYQQDGFQDDGEVLRRDIGLGLKGHPYFKERLRKGARLFARDDKLL